MITSEAISSVLRLDGKGLPIVSLYVCVPVDPSDQHAAHARVHSLLDEVRPMAQNHELGHETMMSLRGDVERIEQAVQEEHWPPGGVALFSCSGRGFFRELQLPREVRDRVVVDSTPWVRTMVAILDEYHRCCVVVVDKGKARMWELYQDELTELGKVRDRWLRNPSGIVEDRAQNKADELAKRHYRNTVANLVELFEAEPFDLVVVGGHHYELPAFLDELPRELSERLAGTFAIDPTTVTAGDIRDQAGALVERYERDEERRLVAEVVERVAAGGRASLGLDDTLWAGSVAAVDKLLVQEGATAPGVVATTPGGWPVPAIAARCATDPPGRPRTSSTSWSRSS
ncbi:MAG: hypothetical protein JWR88_1602 [Pseudonocardia sp.]|nr:hypothetical protein [Pseudonocardia sp.]